MALSFDLIFFSLHYLYDTRLRVMFLSVSHNVIPFFLLQGFVLYNTISTQTSSRDGT